MILSRNKYYIEGKVAGERCLLISKKEKLKSIDEEYILKSSTAINNVIPGNYSNRDDIINVRNKIIKKIHYLAPRIKKYNINKNLYYYIPVVIVFLVEVYIAYLVLEELDVTNLSALPGLDWIIPIGVYGGLLPYSAHQTGYFIRKDKPILALFFFLCGLLLIGSLLWIRLEAGGDLSSTVFFIIVSLLALLFGAHSSSKSYRAKLSRIRFTIIRRFKSKEKEKTTQDDKQVEGSAISKYFEKLVECDKELNKFNQTRCSNRIHYLKGWAEGFSLFSLNKSKRKYE